MKLVSLGLSFGDLIDALEKNNLSTGAGYIEHKGESYLVRAEGRIRNIAEIEAIVIGTQMARRCISTTWRRWASARSCAPAAPAKTARKWWSAPR